MSKIIVIDDDDVVLTLIKGILEQEGYETSIAQSGAQALTMIRLDNPDLVLMDIYMPDMDGFELIDNINQINPELPVIAISAGASHPREVEYLSTIRDLGAKQLLKKPVDKDLLLEAVARYIAA